MKELISKLKTMQPGPETVTVEGWVRTKRDSKTVCFIEVNDGTCLKGLQVVFDRATFNNDNLLNSVTTGCSVVCTGKLVASQGGDQAVELAGETLEVVGPADETYPLQKKRHTLEYLREIAHLRARTNTIGAVARVRSKMAYAVHSFFQQNGFYYVNTPLITASDCEGAGEMFQVTTLDPDNLPRLEDGTIDYSQDFFGRHTSLTVSGQLEGELGAMALGNIYTFGPTFRAENSNTPRHLAEFWMIEPEMAFYDVNDLMDLEEEFIKYLVQYALDNCQDDIAFLTKMIDPELTDRLKSVVSTDFVRLTYTEGIDILLKSGQKFEFPVSWGVDLQSEHERYLVEKHFGKPVILTDYPKDIKAFYMKQNDDGRTVRGTDVLFPKIGEIIGGSERESSLEKLNGRIAELKMDTKNLWWYIDTRRFGSCPHSGFGLGFERLLLFVTGMSNIRDVIPFPRTPKTAEF